MCTISDLTKNLIQFCPFFQIFHFRVDQENRLSNMFPQEVLPQMFANIKSIYKFHAEFLLPQVSSLSIRIQKNKYDLAFKI